MSIEFTFQAGSSVEDGFTIATLGRCRIVRGSVPASDFAMLAHGFSSKAVMSSDLANLMGAAFVIGEPEDIEALRLRDDLPVSPIRRHEAAEALRLSLGEGVSNWLLRGERGLSSNAICKAMFGIPSAAGVEHPLAPDDLQRCLRFLDAAEAHDRIGVMREVSPAWARLVPRWAEITSLFTQECVAGKYAPQTYALMRAILDQDPES